MDENVKLNFSSTLEGSVLMLTCENEMSNINTTDEILHVTCHSNRSWIPDPAQFTCTPFTTVPSATGTIHIIIVFSYTETNKTLITRYVYTLSAITFSASCKAYRDKLL